MTEMEKLFEKMLNMELTNEEMFEQCRNVAHEPMTNEEYLKSCNTEQLAEWIADICDSDEYGCKYDENENKSNWVKWLKQPHKGGES